MSKAIKSYPETKRKAVIARRLAHNTGGLGWLAAQDAHMRELRKAIVKKPVA
jgi:hypothetical protein